MKTTSELIRIEDILRQYTFDRAKMSRGGSGRASKSASLNVTQYVLDKIAEGFPLPRIFLYHGVTDKPYTRLDDNTYVVSGLEMLAVIFNAFSSDYAELNDFNVQGERIHPSAIFDNKKLCKMMEHPNFEHLRDLHHLWHMYSFQIIHVHEATSKELDELYLLERFTIRQIAEKL